MLGCNGVILFCCLYPRRTNRRWKSTVSIILYYCLSTCFQLYWAVVNRRKYYRRWNGVQPTLSGNNHVLVLTWNSENLYPLSSNYRYKIGYFKHSRPYWWIVTNFTFHVIPLRVITWLSGLNLHGKSGWSTTCKNGNWLKFGNLGWKFWTTFLDVPKIFLAGTLK